MTTLRRTRQLLARLDEAGGTSPLRRHEILDELEGLLDAPPPWLLPGLAARVAEACDAPAPTPKALAPGEALLLLRDPVSSAGLVTVLQLTEDATDQDRLSSAARAQATQARRALQAVLADAGRAWPRALPRASDVAVAGLAPDELVDESSLGLSVALAEASRVLRTALPAHIAATAEVRADATLAPVRYLREKVRAIQLDAPDVRTVVVAPGTERDGLDASGVTILEARTLRDALQCFGLSLDSLEPAAIDEAEQCAAMLEVESKRPHTPEAWSDLAEQALAAACTLAQNGQPAQALRCRGWAALFHVHAGAPEHAEACLKPGDEAECDPSVQAMILLSRASAAIDRALPEARRLALEAIELGRKGADRAVLARALGTFGRACTHDGVPAEGTDALREAIELFSRVDAPQSEQTRCYLATNLRTQGRVDDALSVAREAYASCERRRGSEHANDTLRYLSLELGRCWIERGDLDEARVSLARVHRADLGDASYPNIGALASLARIEAASMRNRSASDGVRAPAGAAFARCLEVARRDRSVIGRVAAQALGWQILSQDSDPASSVPWHEVWLARVPEARTREQVRAVVERFLY